MKELGFSIRVGENNALLLLSKRFNYIPHWRFVTFSDRRDSGKGDRSEASSQRPTQFGSVARALAVTAAKVNIPADLKQVDNKNKNSGFGTDRIEGVSSGVSSSLSSSEFVENQSRI